MAIKHISGDFNESHFSKDFGFTGSAEPYHYAGMNTSDRGKPGNPKVPVNPNAPNPTSPTHGTADGGDLHQAAHNDMGDPAMAHGGHMQHPHGHHIVHTEHRNDGATVHHHSHGGMSVHHADGRVTHHHHDGSEAHHAQGGLHHTHPHGHHVTNVQHHADGRVVHHHAHGGHTVHHPDGRITHHHEDGSPVHMAHGAHEGYHDPESELVHRAKGGDVAQDKAMVKKAFRQHDQHMHDGAHEDIELAQGGMPPMARHRMPINRPPRNPQRSVTPRNAMPGGQMGYGVEPSSEPDMAGSDQSVPQLAGGGSTRKHRR